MSLVWTTVSDVWGAHPGSGFEFLCGTYIRTPGPLCAAVWECCFFQTANLLLLYLLTVIFGSSSKHNRCTVISLKQLLWQLCLEGSVSWTKCCLWEMLASHWTDAEALQRLIMEDVKMLLPSFWGCTCAWRWYFTPEMHLSVYSRQ